MTGDNPPTRPYEFGIWLHERGDRAQLYHATVMWAMLLNAARRLGPRPHEFAEIELFRAAAAQWLQLLGFIHAADARGVDTPWIQEVRARQNAELFSDILLWGAVIFQGHEDPTRELAVTDEHIAETQQLATRLEAYASQPLATK